MCVYNKRWVSLVVLLGSPYGYKNLDIIIFNTIFCIIFYNFVLIGFYFVNYYTFAGAGLLPNKGAGVANPLKHLFLVCTSHPIALWHRKAVPRRLHIGQFYRVRVVRGHLIEKNIALHPPALLF